MSQNKEFKNQHLIIDFETLGQDVFKVPVLDCSFLAFDWSRFTTPDPYTLMELVDIAQNYKFNIMTQIEAFGCKFNKRDIEWWESQGSDAKRILAPSDKDVTSLFFVDKFIEYVSNRQIGYWWSRSNTFDPILLQKVATWNNKFDEVNKHIKPWLVRDTRTFIDAKFNFPKINGIVPISDTEYWEKTFVKHDSRFDIAADILRLQSITRIENDMEISVR